MPSTRADFGDPPPDRPETDDGKSLAAKLETLVSLADTPRTPLDGAVELRHPTGELPASAAARVR